MICVRTNITNFVKICLEIKQLFYIKVIAKKPPQKTKKQSTVCFSSFYMQSGCGGTVNW